jgi:hypothetical protein
VGPVIIVTSSLRSFLSLSAVRPSSWLMCAGLVPVGVFSKEFLQRCDLQTDRTSRAEMEFLLNDTGHSGHTDRTDTDTSDTGGYTWLHPHTTQSPPLRGI